MRAWFGKLALAAAGVILATLLPLSLSVPAAAAGTTFSGGTVPEQIVCVSTTTCYVVGQQSNTSGLVFTVTNGVASTPATVSSVFDISDIACTSATACYGVGQIGGPGSFVGMALPITSGNAGSPTQVGGTFTLNGIACVPGTTTCYAVGDNSNLSTGQGELVPVTGGSVGAAATVAGTEYLSAIACPTATACYAVGGAGGGGAIVAIDAATGSAGTPDVVGSTTTLDGIACPTSSSCLAVGAGGTIVPFTVNGTTITLGSASTVSGIGQWYGVGCPNSATCFALGTVTGYQTGAYSIIANGVPGPAIAVSQTAYFTGAACPTTATCELVGADFVPYAFNGILDVMSLTGTSLDASAPSVGLNQPVTLTATVTPQAPATGTPTGTVDFYDGTTLLGSGTLNQSNPDEATLTTSALAKGPHTITAVYGGDDSFFTSAAAAVDVTVGRAGTTTTVTTTPSPSQFGEAVNIAATVTASAPGAGTPTGTVDFYDGGAEIGSAKLNQATPDVATFATSSLSVGAHTITAEYQGDASFQASPMSGSAVQTVNQAGTSTSVGSSANPSVIGQPVTFTAQVTAGGSPVAAGSVTFYDGTASLGTVSLSAAGGAALSTSALTAGAHAITAAYGGSADYLASTSAELAQNVNKASTTLTLTSAVSSPATCQPEPGADRGTTGCDPDGDGHPGGTCGSGFGAFTGAFTGAFNGAFNGCHRSGGQPGTSGNGGCALGAFGGFNGCDHGNSGHPGTADHGGGCASGLGGPHLTPGAFGTVSGAVYGIVQVPSGPDTSTVCQAVTLTATVAAVPPATGAPTGTVTFTDGATTLGSASLATTGGVTSASLTVASLPAGAQAITATYGGDATFQGSSASITQEVQYIFVGLLPPLSGGHAVDPRATVPVAFTLLNGAGQVVRDATATLSVDGQAPVAFQLRGDRYQYDLRLRGLGVSGTVNLTIQVSDGSTHTFTLTLAAPNASRDHGH